MKINLLANMIVIHVVISTLLLAQEKSLTVCDALQHLDLYRGDTIAVKGIIAGDFYHGFAMRDHSTQRECQKIAESGRHWPASIPLSFPIEGWTPSDGPLKFSPDTKNIESFLDAMKKFNEQAFKRNDYNYYYVATVIGELRSRDDIEIDYNSSGDFYAGNGYGNGGKCAAEFIVKSIADLQLVDIRALKR
jgi:hypothetical protein